MFWSKLAGTLTIYAILAVTNGCDKPSRGIMNMQWMPMMYEYEYAFPPGCLLCDVNIQTLSSKHSPGKYCNPKLLIVNNSEPEHFND